MHSKLNESEVNKMEINYLLNKANIDDDVHKARGGGINIFSALSF